MTVLEKVKNNLRVSSDGFDDEIITLILSACTFIRNAGVNHTVTLEAINDNTYVIDSAVMTLIVLFCKSYFGIQNTKDIELPHLFYLTLKQMEVCK